MQILTLISIGLSLSIDAFTLSMAYGLLKVPKKQIILTSLSVGIFHFLMPLIGFDINTKLDKYIDINEKLILTIILILILIEMIKSFNEEKEYHKFKLTTILSFSLLVSIDAFTLGLGLEYITNNICLASLIFMSLSSIFTFLGFNLGKYTRTKFEKYSKLISIIVLLLITVYIICKPWI